MRGRGNKLYENVSGCLVYNVPIFEREFLVKRNAWFKYCPWLECIVLFIQTAAGEMNKSYCTSKLIRE